MIATVLAVLIDFAVDVDPRDPGRGRGSNREVTGIAASLIALHATAPSRLALAAALASLAACPTPPDEPLCDAACRAQAQPDGCVSTADYFTDYAWPLVFSECVSCHVAGGRADGTRFVLRPADAPDFAAQNLLVLAEAANLRLDGVPLLLLKPTGTIEHGGGALIEPGGLQIATIEETLARIATPVDCPDDPPAGDLFDGVELLDPYWTLRKAALALVSRPPTDAEIAGIDAGGLDALDPILLAMMDEPAFDERVREIFGDVLLTDGFRANNTTGGATRLIDSTQQPAGVSYWGGADWSWRSWPAGEGIRLTEALAREPLEFLVRAFAEDAPLGTALTAPHRLINAYSARFYGIPYRGFAPGTPFADIPEPTRYEEALVPLVNEDGAFGEYAGLLTTPAWLARYPSSPTNFNRRRARFTLKLFLDFDIMKTAPRIDASAVDLSAVPTLNNDQCTGCHAQIDPLAGAYKNWDECGWSGRHFYRVPDGAADPRGERKATACQTPDGWPGPSAILPPGVGQGAANALTSEEGRFALEALAAHVVQERSFARSMATHVFLGLMGRSLRSAPTDPEVPDYAALDRAYAAEQQELNRLADVLEDGGLRPRALVLAVVRSPFFRAARADEPGRVELSGVGGGVLVPPEQLDRFIEAATGVRWRRHGWAIPRDSGYQSLGRHDGSEDAFLALREELKTLYGGIDGTADGVKARQREPSTLTAAIVEQMALAVSCEAVAREFSMEPDARLLFAQVEASEIPTGDPAQDAAVLSTLAHLHQRLLGDRLADDDPELLASYALLLDAREAGLVDLASGAASAGLSRPCSADLDLSTATATPGGVTQDPDYVVRAWQTVLSYLLMDPRVVFTP